MMNINSDVYTGLFDRVSCLRKLIEKCEDPEELNNLYVLVERLDQTKITTKKEDNEFFKNREIFKPIIDKINICMAKKMKRRNRKW